MDDWPRKPWKHVICLAEAGASQMIHETVRFGTWIFLRQAGHSIALPAKVVRVTSMSWHISAWILRTNAIVEGFMYM